ncbi:peptidoglycan-binding protein [Microbacterium suaedae]|uniref:peptidoglycan-binding protein n=1 Tax=Microbacterium suaedae TaxID=2067813 RepID=UPI000DA1AD86|nr:peptidoglycan-binding protein [Microbacterium suaedae]
MIHGTADPRRRRPVITGVVVIVAGAVMLAAGWAMASAFRSPAQIAAEAVAPEPSTITAPVTQGMLADVINAQGTVAASGRTTAPIGSADGAGVVTAHPVTEGDAIAAGDVVLEVSNQPVFAMPGTFPFFRDIADGDTGRDVEQLQAALRAAGFDVAADGVYGPGTQRAVRALYEQAGYAAPTLEVAEETAPESPEEESGSGEDTEEPPARTTIVAPASAFAVTGSLPATALSLPPVGALSGDASIAFASGDPVVTVSVLEATAALLEPGFGAEMQRGGEPIPLTLERIGEPDDEGGVALTFRAVVDGSLADAMGEDAVVAVTRSVVADDALLVPSTAVASRGDVRYVLREAGDGDFTEVPVRELGTLDGTSAIEPKGDDALAVDDFVRIP